MLLVVLGLHRCMGFSLVVASEVRSFHCDGFACCRARALGVLAPVVVTHRFGSCRPRALEHRLYSYSAQA